MHLHDGASWCTMWLPAKDIPRLPRILVFMRCNLLGWMQLGAVTVPATSTYRGRPICWGRNAARADLATPWGAKNVCSSIPQETVDTCAPQKRGNAHVDRSASQTTVNGCSTVVFHLPSYEARSSIASRYLSSEEACAERERHKNWQ